MEQCVSPKSKAKGSKSKANGSKTAGMSDLRSVYSAMAKSQGEPLLKRPIPIGGTVEGNAEWAELNSQKKQGTRYQWRVP